MVKVTKDDIGRKIRVTNDAYAFPDCLVGRVGYLAGVEDDYDGLPVLRVTFDDHSWFTRPDSIEFVDEPLLKVEVVGYDEQYPDSCYEVQIGDTIFHVSNGSIISTSDKTQDNEEKRKVRVFSDCYNNGYLNFDEDLKSFFISDSIELKGFKIEFTKAEIVEANKLPQFKYVDLVQAWEDGE